MSERIENTEMLESSQEKAIRVRAQLDLLADMRACPLSSFDARNYYQDRLEKAWLEMARENDTCCRPRCDGIGENRFPYCEGHNAP